MVTRAVFTWIEFALARLQSTVGAQSNTGGN